MESPVEIGEREYKYETELRDRHGILLLHLAKVIRAVEPLIVTK